MSEPGFFSPSNACKLSPARSPHSMACCTSVTVSIFTEGELQRKNWMSQAGNELDANSSPNLLKSAFHFRFYLVAWWCRVVHTSSENWFGINPYTTRNSKFASACSCWKTSFCDVSSYNLKQARFQSYRIKLIISKIPQQLASWQAVWP